VHALRAPALSGGDGGIEDWSQGLMVSFVDYEQTTPTLTATIVDSENMPVPGQSISSILLTLYDEDTLQIINSRDHQSVLAGDVTVDINGVLMWVLEPADMVILNDDLAEEPHVGLFEISWTAAGKSRVIRLPMRIFVRNLGEVI
jgi:hypothetical protein